MFTLASPAFSNPPYLELLFSILAFMFMQAAVRIGATRAGGCFIGYGLTLLVSYVILQFSPYGQYVWDHYVYLFYQYFVPQGRGHFYPWESNVALKLYVIYPWLLLSGTVWLIPKKPKHTSNSEPRVYCTGCSHNLVAVTTSSCPECGRTFNAQDPSTTSRNKTRNTYTLGRLKDYKILHRSIILLMVMPLLAMILLMNEPHELLGVVILATFFALALFLLWVQTNLALKVLGEPYALGYLILTLLLSYVFLLGVIIVPFLVMNDIKRKWKTQPQPSQAKD